MSVPIWSPWRAEKERKRRREVAVVSMRGKTKVSGTQSLSVRTCTFGGGWVAQYGKVWSRGHTNPIAAVAEVLEKAKPIEQERVAVYGREWRGILGYSREYAVRVLQIELHNYYAVSTSTGNR